MPHPLFSQRRFSLQEQKRGLLATLGGALEGKGQYSVTSPDGGVMFVDRQDDQIDAFADESRREHLIHAQRVRSTLGGGHIREYQPSEEHLSTLVWHVYAGDTRAWIGAYNPQGPNAGPYQITGIVLFGADGTAAGRVDCNRSSGEVVDLFSIVSKETQLAVLVGDRRAAHGTMARSPSSPAPVTLELNAPLAPLDPRVVLLACLALL